MAYQKDKTLGSLLRQLRSFSDFVLGLTVVKSRIYELQSKVDLLRNEILFEMRYGKTETQRLETRIINRQKYESLIEQDELILNIGAGTNCFDSMLNIDMRELPNIDVVADAADIQLPQGIAKGLFSAHVLEHFPHERLRRAVLPQWVALLRQGGFFRAIVPDAETMMAAYINKEMPFEDLRTVTFGLQEYAGDSHHTMFSRQSIVSLLEEAGLRDVTIMAASRQNGLCLEMEIVGYK